MHRAGSGLTPCFPGAAQRSPASRRRQVPWVLGLWITAGALGCGDDAGAGGGGGATGSNGGSGGAASGEGGDDGSGGSVTAVVATATASSASAASSAGGEPFALEVHTTLTGASLTLETNLPHHVGPCLALTAVGAPCADDDGDGLVDAWEDLALDRLRPLVILDEDEELVNVDGFRVGLVGRVAPVGERIHLLMMLGYAEDFGSCGFTAHHGDSERVALAVSPVEGSDGDVVIEAAYTAAHEGTDNDHGRVFEGAALGELVFGVDPTSLEPRWAVFASANKHATYGSIEICEGVSTTPCLDEDCGPDGVDAASHTLLFPFVNAGEEAAPMVTDLGLFGFPGDDAWAAQDFCGGLGGDGCSSPVRDKLLADPF